MPRSTRMPNRDARDGMAKPMRDPRDGVMGFFHALASGQIAKGFNEDMAGVIKHITQRAQVRQTARWLGGAVGGAPPPCAHTPRAGLCPLAARPRRLTFACPALGLAGRLRASCR